MSEREAPKGHEIGVPESGGDSHKPHGGLLGLTIGAMGVVYGDIGTSPLYAINEIFYGHGGVKREADAVIGCISLIIWTLTSVIAFKYVLFVLRADNDGEGGTFALYGLIHRYKRLGLGALLSLLILAAGLLFGEGVITPAISVLSAVEGLEVAAPSLTPFIIPITLAILTVLFFMQRHGTAKVGSVFGPIIVCWFASIGILGARQVLMHSEVLAAFNPIRGISFLRDRGLLGALPVLGGVVLAITGGEALYADMGHFGKAPIRASWFGAVYPALLLNYLGQGAFLIGGEPVRNENVFFSLVPIPLLVPMVLLATCATIIASQALISGAFSLSAQAAALGLFPRLQVVHTHQAHAGQIYVPFINWALFAGCTTLVVHFGSSTALAAAYGLSVSGVMLSTSIAMTAIARLRWNWSWAAIGLAFVPVGVIDATFLGANSTKFLEGGYVPFSLGMVVFLVMTTWRWGRKATFAAYSSKHTMTMAALVELKKTANLLERNAILMVPKPIRSLSENTPALLQLVWDRQGALPKNLIFVEVVHKKAPYVHKDRVQVTVFDRDPDRGCIVSVALSFGFMEEPNVERVLEHLAGHHEIDLPPDPHLWIVHASQEHLLIPRKTKGWMLFRLRLFALLRQIAQPSYYYYGVGNEVQLSTEIMPVRLAKG